MRNNLDIVKQIAVAARIGYHADGKAFDKFISSDPHKPEKAIDANGISKLMAMQGGR